MTVTASAADCTGAQIKGRSGRPAANNLHLVKVREDDSLPRQPLLVPRPLSCRFRGLPIPRKFVRVDIVGVWEVDQAFREEGGELGGGGDGIVEGKREEGSSCGADKKGVVHLRGSARCVRDLLLFHLDENNTARVPSVRTHTMGKARSLERMQERGGQERDFSPAPERF